MVRGGVIVALVAALAIGGWFFWRSPMSVSKVAIGNTIVEVEVASTNAARERGLSGRDTLAEGRGMLFIFDMPGRHGFWMKDTRIALDIIYAGRDKKIITIHHNVSPESYLKNPPEVFYPSSNALYVLEVPAGYAKKQGIAEGMTIVLQ